MTFGDDGPDDSYTAGGVADPEQVAARLHDLRRGVEELAGRRLEPWYRLPADQRALGVALIAAVLEWLRRERDGAVSGRYLSDLAAVLAAAGQSVVELDGWQTRARSSGGYDDGGPWCLMIHHTASNGDGAADAHYCTFGSSDRPVTNLVLGRDAVWYVCAAGATNTNGKGGPWPLADGKVIAANQMNLRAVAIEMSNDGTGMAYPAPMIDALFAGIIALSNAYLGGRYDLLAGHVDWAPGRKIDPATGAAVEGSWQPRTFTSSGSWISGDVIVEAQRRAFTPTPPDPQPEDDDVKLYLVRDPRDGAYYVTDTATFKTHVGTQAVADDGVQWFGWTAQPQGGPWELNPQWASLLDALPTTAP